MHLWRVQRFTGAAVFILFKIQSCLLTYDVEQLYAWGRTVSPGSQVSEGSGLLFQHRLAVPDPQLVRSFQGFFASVIEYLCKIRLVVNWTSREASPACIH